jgi:Putative integral membrane protein DUF46.
MNKLLEMYISLLPAIVAGILNMVWCKANIFTQLSKPIDNYKVLNDNERLFGDNKTWKGFIGMIIFGAICTAIWGFICGTSGYLFEHNYLYSNLENNIVNNILMGALFGLAYAVFELPNSFMKRRLKIDPGKRLTGIKGALFVFIDQADSVVGCVLVLSIVHSMSLGFFLLYIFIGAFTHIVINILLYFCKLRKNMF